MTTVAPGRTLPQQQQEDSGLSSEEAARLLQQGGPNKITQAKGPSPLCARTPSPPHADTSEEVRKALWRRRHAT